jgi:hypothetical protein
MFRVMFRILDYCYLLIFKNVWPHCLTSYNCTCNFKLLFKQLFLKILKCCKVFVSRALVIPLIQTASSDSEGLPIAIPLFTLPA